ncbi:coth protein-domain-containing protein [Mycotypha africana]|uniref:coth protein-domain-containing protein n=1 Tax=Mycotypha africana TaxID=64632 RepID=UPI00230174DC|nr:coth protein-domain-containing protein [Mycotypha africana]KAI8967067.1 coth protein-domain-containing protein [Mycotypha africana]
MKLFSTSTSISTTKTSGVITLAISLLSCITTAVQANNVTYSVVAFPSQGEQVVVNVNNQTFALAESATCMGLYTGNAPFASEYHYALVNAHGQQTPEKVKRSLANANTTTTGNEFFDRSRTFWDIPEIPQAYPPIFPSKASEFGNSNQIATVIARADGPALQKILDDPDTDHSYVQMYNMTYINHDHCFSFMSAGLKNSGQSSKKYTKQSWNIKFGKFDKNADDKLYGRKAIKLRAEAVDPAFIRDKLAMDSLQAAGAIHTEGSFARFFVNGEPYGLYLMTDEEFKGFTDNLMNGGQKDAHIGPTYKANSLGPDQCADLVYKGPDNSSYAWGDIYSLGDQGRDPTSGVTKKSYAAPLMDFMKRLNETTHGNTTAPGTIVDLMDNTNQTMIQLAMNMLMGAWDGLWYTGTNFYLTEHMDTKKWTLITYDFDDTFGNGMQDEKMLTAPYQSFAPEGAKRPLVEAFIKDPYFQPQFEEILKTIVQKSFNPSNLKPRIDAYTQMLEQDIAWDYGLKRKAKGVKKDFTLESFKKNMYSFSDDSIGIMEWIGNRTIATAKQLNVTLNQPTNNNNNNNNSIRL